MELKTYQKDVLKKISSYMKCLNDSTGIFSAWKKYWDEQDISIGLDGVPAYKDTITGVPHVCAKVPTGGGKTYLGCAALKRIFDEMPTSKCKVVVWLVPSEPILNQTIKNLSDTNHPYRQKLEHDFAGRVGIYTKEMLLNGQNFSPDTVREMLTVCILSYGSLRINNLNKDIRKVYQENGNLIRFAEYFKDKSVLLADTPDTALIQVLRSLSPVIIIDESHNAESELSIEMINNLNPSFIFDLTATPKNNSNIVSYVNARELKKENMVKLPIIVYNRTSRQSVIQDAIQLRGCIEKQAIEAEKKGGAYIRPIVLFQAQPNINAESETFDKIKKMLIAIGIPENEIAIKTSEIDDLKKVDLLSKDCDIRYIITVNALKEGWDCPFAYILASLANKTSKVDVEQIVGRILRQPYAREHKAPLLNSSFVLTCSADFHSTLENIVRGLNNAGFSKKDFRVGTLKLTECEDTISNGEQETKFEQQELFCAQEDSIVLGEKDSFEDIATDEIKNIIGEIKDDPEKSVADMITTAEKQAEEYNTSIADADLSAFIWGELGEMLNQNNIQEQYRETIGDIKIPQFYFQTTPDLFGNDFELLEPENLSDGFSLSGQNAEISFELATGEMYQVDIQEQGEAVPKYKKANKAENEYIREFLAKLPPERKIANCVDIICKQINRNDRYAATEIADYVRRVVENMTDDEMSAMETNIPVYALKIQKKIEKLEYVYREDLFYKLIDSGKIVCKESYNFPPVITPSVTTNAIPYSLYEAEKNDMNDFENNVIDTVVGLGNVEWWHRIIERKDFRINAFINHYPDFIVKTKNGNIVLIEAKGDYLDGDDSKTKLKLGREWQSQAGRLYRYFMVFKDKELGEQGAYTLDKFVEVMKNL